MWDAVVRILLNGMELPFFIAMYLCALAGMVVLFARDVRKGMKTDARTPRTFSWAVMFKMSAMRLISSVIVLAFAVVYYPQIMEELFSVPVSLEIGPVQAFLMGVCVDRLVDGIIGAGETGVAIARKNGK